jgi:hypothetical protein
MPLQLKLTVDPISARALRSALEQVPLDLQDKAAGKAMRRFGRVVIAQARPSMRSATVRRGLVAKVKRYKLVTWLGIGTRMNRLPQKTQSGSRAKREAYDAYTPGWRSHWEELGWHTWSKGWQRARRGLGRAWKRGLRHRGRGVFHHGSLALTTSARSNAAQFQSIVAAEIDAYTRSISR